MKTQEYIQLEELYGAHNYHPLDVVVKEARGVWVTDVEGRRFLDCLAAYSAVNQGHCHPKILEALMAQARRLSPPPSIGPVTSGPTDRWRIHRLAQLVKATSAGATLER